jgi:hypothetical protein
MAQYAQQHDNDDSLGGVQGRRTSQYAIDITLTVPDAEAGADEFVIRVNGRPVKRLGPHEATRLGLISPDTPRHQWT